VLKKKKKSFSGNFKLQRNTIFSLQKLTQKCDSKNVTEKILSHIDSHGQCATCRPTVTLNVFFSFISSLNHEIGRDAGRRKGGGEGGGAKVI
jgi:hypothetical protein